MKTKGIITFCGGHITPAVAVIDAIRTRDDYSIEFIGRKHAIEGSRELSFEYKLIVGKGIHFVSITTGRLQRHLSWQTIPSLLKIPIGVVQALWYCIHRRPALIVSFGGYIALPVSIAAWLCRIPVITHEQTMVAGLANRIIAHIARRVCVTFPESVNQFPEGKAVYTGLPIRDELFVPPKKPLFAFNKNSYPMIYVTGGGTGAQSLNRLLFPLLPSLLKRFTIVHQVGDTSFAEAQNIQGALDEEYKSRYVIEPYIPIGHLSWVLSQASLVIGRSGANTVMELAALGKVALFVPLPWSGGGEQQKNAEWLVREAGAIMVPQQGLTPLLFERHIGVLWKNLKKLQERSDNFAKKIPRDGTIRLTREIEHILVTTP